MAREDGLNKVPHNYAENLRFNDKSVKFSCDKTGYNITFYGVGARH